MIQRHSSGARIHRQIELDVKQAFPQPWPYRLSLRRRSCRLPTALIDYLLDLLKADLSSLRYHHCDPVFTGGAFDRRRSQ